MTCQHNVYVTSAILVVFIIVACLAYVQSAPCPTPPFDPKLEELKKSQQRMLIGIGAQKGGSSFLYRALVTHPQVIAADEKELHVFDKKHFQSSLESYTEYLENWDESLEAKGNPKDAVLLEFSPKYLLHADAPCRIKHFFPNAKFIVTMREPVSRLLSENTMKRSHCSPHHKERKDTWPTCCEKAFQPVVEKLERALEELEEMKDECLNPDIQDPWQYCDWLPLHIIARSLYAPQIAWWLQNFNSSQFIFIHSRDLDDNPHRELNRVLRFAGISPEFNSSVSFSEIPAHTGTVTFTEPGLDDMSNRLEKMFEKLNQDLYRILKENGHDFAPFQSEPQRLDMHRRPLSDGADLCCSGADFEHLTLTPGFQAETDFCKDHQMLTAFGEAESNGTFISFWLNYWLLLLGSVVVVLLLIRWGWKSKRRRAKEDDTEVGSLVSDIGVIDKHGSILRRQVGGS